MSKTTKKAPTKTAILKALKADYPHIRSVATTNAKGKPIRVVIRCTGTQDGHAEDCSTDREIATQDAFQVLRSTECQRLFSRIRRRKTAPEA